MNDEKAGRIEMTDEEAPRIEEVAEMLPNEGGDDCLNCAGKSYC